MKVLSDKVAFLRDLRPEKQSEWRGVANFFEEVSERLTPIQKNQYSERFAKALGKMMGSARHNYHPNLDMLQETAQFAAHHGVIDAFKRGLGDIQEPFLHQIEVNPGLYSYDGSENSRANKVRRIFELLEIPDEAEELLERDRLSLEAHSQELERAINEPSISEILKKRSLLSENIDDPKVLEAFLDRHKEVVQALQSEDFEEHLREVEKEPYTGTVPKETSEFLNNLSWIISTSTLAKEALPEFIDSDTAFDAARTFLFVSVFKGEAFSSHNLLHANSAFAGYVTNLLPGRGVELLSETLGTLFATQRPHRLNTLLSDLRDGDIIPSKELVLTAYQDASASFSLEILQLIQGQEKSGAKHTLRILEKKARLQQFVLEYLSQREGEETNG